MGEEIVTTENNQMDYKKYIDAIQETQRNSVPKEVHQKLQEENAYLMDALLNGKAIENSSAEETAKADPQELSTLLTDIFENASNLSDLEITEKILKARDLEIELGIGDALLAPLARNQQYSSADKAKVEENVTVLKGWVEYADGDRDIFKDTMKRKLY